MQLHLTKKQYRRLLDMVYIGNWILNSTRGDDRISEYDDAEAAVFAAAKDAGMEPLSDIFAGEVVPSRAFVEGGIHEAIMDYEDTVFFEILAEELARRDMQEEQADPNDLEELNSRIGAYIAEFESNGCDNVSVNCP